MAGKARAQHSSHVPDVQLRRSPHLVCYWRNDRLVYENYLTGTCVAGSPFCTSILDFFDHWRKPAELIAALSGFSRLSINRELHRLCSLSLLEEWGKENPRSAAMQTWAAWSPEASFFHFASKDVQYRVDREISREDLVDYIRGRPQPAFFKRYSNVPRVRLPRVPCNPISEFARVLYERRTWREFSRGKLPLEKLAQLLRITWGVTGYVQVDELGHLPLRTSPSAGARHPGEVYLVALKVEDLPQGLYHYSSDVHCLERLRETPMKQRAQAYLAKQWWYADAAAIFLMTAVFSRNSWKYRYSRAYRSVLLDAGHLCQTFCLTATWLGLAPFCTMALADSLIEADLGIDGVSESVLYAAGVGLRARNGAANFFPGGRELKMVKRPAPG
jgi:SagB-type dehydrogenase family enzyme